MVGFPKPRPRALQKADRLKLREKVDKAESAKVKARSGGRCELIDLKRGRCGRRALHIHHRLSGIGVRGRGASAKAENKLNLCDRCHSDIHAHILVPDGAHFRRVR